jgi:hypothetical protein
MVTEHLEEAGKLYEQYLAIARVTEVPTTLLAPEDPPAPPVPNTPLTLVFWDET